MRDNHRKALNLRKTRSGQAASKTKPPKYEKELSFLAPYLLDDAIRQLNFPSPGGVDDGNDDGEDSVTANDSNLSVHSSARSSYTSRSKRSKKCTSSEEPSAAAILKEYLDAKDN